MLQEHKGSIIKKTVGNYLLLKNLVSMCFMLCDIEWRSLPNVGEVNPGLFYIPRGSKLNKTTVSIYNYFA